MNKMIWVAALSMLLAGPVFAQSSTGPVPVTNTPIAVDPPPPPTIKEIKEDIHADRKDIREDVKQLEAARDALHVKLARLGKKLSKNMALILRKL